jgi:hypothetical protein
VRRFKDMHFNSSVLDELQGGEQAKDACSNYDDAIFPHQALLRVLKSQDW